MAGTTGLEPAASAVTALRELVLQQLTTTRGLPNAAQVIQDHTNCGLGCGLGNSQPRPLPAPSSSLASLDYAGVHTCI